MDQYILVLTTMPDKNQAEQLAEKLVTAKLAACINIMPQMTSIYEWNGQLEKGTEHLILIKTRNVVYEKLENTLKAEHPYSVPEIISLPIEAGLQDYLNWIDENTTSSR